MDGELEQMVGLKAVEWVSKRGKLWVMRLICREKEHQKDLKLLNILSVHPSIP